MYQVENDKITDIPGKDVAFNNSSFFYWFLSTFKSNHPRKINLQQLYKLYPPS